MDITIAEFLIKKAEEQLQTITSPIEDGEWFDELISELQEAINASDLDPDEKTYSNKIIDILIFNKDSVIGLGIDVFTLMIHQIASGQSNTASGTYLQAMGSADLIIKAMNEGTVGLIKAKQKLDAIHNSALELIKQITVAGAKALLPFLLSLV